MLIPKEIVIEAKAKMGDKAAQIIADYYQLEHWDTKNLKGCCPKHKEDTPSFVWMDKTNNFHCFGCNANIGIVDVYMEQGMSFVEACEKLFEETGTKFRFSEKGIKTKKEYRYPNAESEELSKEVVEYVKKRGLSEETMARVHLADDGNGNVVFQYHNIDDVLVLVKYRPARKIKPSENKTWCQKNADTMPVLFNMNRVDVTKPLLICEGEFDCMSAIEAGFTNAVSVPLGAGNEGWIQENWEWLEQFDKFIIWADNDTAGEKMRKAIVPRLGTWKCYIVEGPHETVYNGKPVKIKDINETLLFLGKETVLKAIEEAREVPITNVVDFSTVEDFDLENAEGVYTGNKDLDTYISKFFFGTLNIFTGVNGSGKSSLVNQVLISQAIHQGHDVFVYSGELPNWQLRNWILFNLAGRRHVETIQKPNQPPTYRLKAETKKQISDYYADRIYFYDNEVNRTSEALLLKMEEMARKKGTKVFIIDNLTVVDLGSNDTNKYDKQKDFVLSLVSFAKKFNVVVALVIHPHKIDTIRRMTKMDIAGSMSLSDLAHRVFTVHRVTKKEKEGIPNKKGGWLQEPIEWDVLFDVLKDRFLGCQDTCIGMNFDSPSRRFWTDMEELDFCYSWDKGNYAEKLDNPRKKELPQFMVTD